MAAVGETRCCFRNLSEARLSRSSIVGTRYRVNVRGPQKEYCYLSIPDISWWRIIAQPGDLEDAELEAVLAEIVVLCVGSSVYLDGVAIKDAPMTKWRRPSHSLKSALKPPR